MKQWLSTAGAFKVERVPCPNPAAPVDMTRPASGVLHTTEGSTIDGALSVFKQHYAPHFLVGEGRILQLVPLGTEGAALQNLSGGVETNAWARAQIEIVGFSKMPLWKPGPASLEPLAALLATLNGVASIPLTHPFPSLLNPDTTWATPTNPHRLSGKWGKTAGWYGHIDVPENDHWDCGSLDWNAVFSHAAAYLPVTSWNVTSTTPKGHTQTVTVKHPVAHSLKHPKMFRRGRVTFTPRRGGGG